ncbi:sigma-70 family RNA polymerase sigma factor [uncultured Chitinophaga sp.]|uniref:RNA polymerase sigma factor n=1 Tax=uncultured Chitinophaga sp. TaxID=339340 RepID=UPI00260A980E|nr:sigma-70 family RNA polymerase sigma factor [uncultured Chitinophaga sp.]
MFSKENELLARLQKGENLDAVFKDIYDKYYAYCFQCVNALVDDSDDVADVVQTVFITLFTEQYYKTSTSLVHLLKLMCRQRAINFLHKKKKEAEKLRAYQAYCGQHQLPHFSDQVFERMDDVVLHMPQKLRSVTEAYFNRFKYKQIAATLNINVHSVKQYVQKAINCIKTQIPSNETY